MQSALTLTIINFTKQFRIQSFPMAIKIKHTDNFSTYFITFTCINWIPLFETVQAYDKVYEWFGILKAKYGSDIIDYVIMPNHLHIIMHFKCDGFNLNKIIANGKRFMA